MKYWGYLVAKLVVAVVSARCLWEGVKMLLPPPKPLLQVGGYAGQPFGHDLNWTFAAGLCIVAGCVLVYFALIDQRYRCRVCLRRVRMPITTGSRSRMLQLGRPRMEYICPFGHGTLRISERIEGLDESVWEARAEADMWKELEALGGKH